MHICIPRLLSQIKNKWAWLHLKLLLAFNQLNQLWKAFSMIVHAYEFSDCKNDTIYNVMYMWEQIGLDVQ